MIELAALPTSLPSAPGPSRRARVTLESGRSAGHRWVRTVGLRRLGLPELVVSGLSPAVARSLLAPLVAELRRSRRRRVRRRFDVGGVPVRLVPLERTEVMQVVWGDEAGRLPGDLRCRRAVVEAQERLAGDPLGSPTFRLIHGPGDRAA